MFQDHRQQHMIPLPCPLLPPISFFFASGCHLVALSPSLSSQWELQGISEVVRRMVEDHYTIPLQQNEKSILFIPKSYSYPIQY